MRERFLLWGAAIGGAVLILLIAVGAYLGYGWYEQRYGPTAEKALREYFTALGSGDYAVMYEMTPDSDLMVLGHKLSEADFASRVEELLGGEEMEVQEIELERIAQRDEYHYFRVSLHYRLGGTGKVARLLVEVKATNGDWEVTYPFTPSL
jgi:hypothetical protein